MLGTDYTLFYLLNLQSRGSTKLETGERDRKTEGNFRIRHNQKGEDIRRLDSILS